MKHPILSKVSLRSGILIALALTVWSPGAARAAEHGKGMSDTMPMPGAGAMTHMQHITTQAQAEALMPGDSMSMTCTTCKEVMVQTVTPENTHVKMMTVGTETTCGGCEGTVKVVATGKGKGKDAEVKHVCSKCGDNAMFCSATKPGTGAAPGMGKMKM